MVFWFVCFFRARSPVGLVLLVPTSLTSWWWTATRWLWWITSSRAGKGTSSTGSAMKTLSSSITMWWSRFISRVSRVTRISRENVNAAASYFGSVYTTWSNPRNKALISVVKLWLWSSGWSKRSQTHLTQMCFLWFSLIPSITCVIMAVYNVQFPWNNCYKAGIKHSKQLLIILITNSKWFCLHTGQL